MRDTVRLHRIKLLHTVAWAFFAGCTIVLPIAAATDHLRFAGLLAAIVFVEVLILLVNGWHCPLTPLAARYTTDRRANFDIFLPEWLARLNKRIFGAVYIAGLLILLYKAWR
ncbi:MAG TPA: hypothetical protein VFN22_05395 [Gemmatimonadales bacterium]|nr:hypothetical protein [Gemmatimonadales bacterium]